MSAHDDLSLEYFFNEEIKNIYSVFSSILNALTISISPIHIFIVLTQSKTLGKFQFLLLNHTVWCICFEIGWSLARPVLLFPAASLYFLDPLNFLTTPRRIFICIVTVLFIGTLSCGGICMTLVYRYLSVFPGFFSHVFTSKYSFAVYILVHLSIAAFLGYYGYLVSNLTREDMIYKAMNYSKVFEKFTDEKTFVFVDKQTIKIGVLFTTGVLVFILTGFIIGVIVLSIVFSKLNHIDCATQRMLILSCVAQVIVSLGFQVVPFLIFFILLSFEIPYSGPIMQINECFFVSHAFLEILVTLYFVTPYRHFLTSKLGQISPKTVVGLISIQNNQSKVVLIKS